MFMGSVFSILTHSRGGSTLSISLLHHTDAGKNNNIKGLTENAGPENKRPKFIFKLDT